MNEENRGFSEFVGWCDRSIVSGTNDKKFIDILSKEDMARVYSYIKEGAEQEAFKIGYIAGGLDELKKKDDSMNTALNDSKRFRIKENEGTYTLTASDNVTL